MKSELTGCYDSGEGGTDGGGGVCCGSKRTGHWAGWLRSGSHPGLAVTQEPSASLVTEEETEAQSQIALGLDPRRQRVKCQGPGSEPRGGGARERWAGRLEEESPREEGVGSTDDGLESGLGFKSFFHHFLVLRFGAGVLLCLNLL